MPKRARTVLDNTAALVGEIAFNSIEENPNISITQENPTTLTSYNLLPKNRRTIIVPGSPSIWTPPKLPVPIEPDHGRYFSDPVRHIFPKCPLEPLFRALSVTKPDFDINAVDLITDRRNLRLLLSFIKGSNAEFRIDVEVAGATVMFSCWLKKTTSFVNGFMGYGREFEKKFTQVPNSVAGSVTHNRAVGYTFGGLRMVVRFEVDGFMNDGIPGSTASTSSTGSTQGLGEYTDPGHTITKQYDGESTPTGFTLSIRGSFVPPHQIIEIKTGAKGKDLCAKAMDQIWFSCTPILCGGHYDAGGTFASVAVEDKVKQGQLTEWEKENAKALRKLVNVLERIREEVRKVPGGKGVIAHQGGSQVLRIYSVANGSVCGLPADILARWND